ncbi:hypothetical protein MBRA_04286 [Methylobacterium brachiatum]|nr:hypothetical protein MBRA_04286 [Methylobacterium brachiatum]
MREQHVVGLGGVHHHQQERVGTVSRLRQGLGRSPAQGRDSRAALRPDVVAAHGKPRGDEMARHRQAHGAEADEGEAAHSHPRMLRAMAAAEIP